MQSERGEHDNPQCRHAEECKHPCTLALLALVPVGTALRHLLVHLLARLGEALEMYVGSVALPHEIQVFLHTVLAAHGNTPVGKWILVEEDGQPLPQRTVAHLLAQETAVCGRNI